MFLDNNYIVKRNHIIYIFAKRFSSNRLISPHRYFIFHKPNKTWQQVFWLSISIAINNAYILYKMSDAYTVKRYSRAQFGERLVRELLDLDDCSPTQWGREGGWWRQKELTTKTLNTTPPTHTFTLNLTDFAVCVYVIILKQCQAYFSLPIVVFVAL